MAKKRETELLAQLEESRKRETELSAQLEESRRKETELTAQLEKLKKDVQVLTQPPPLSLSSAPAQTYKVGDRGPAGGIIFCDKGDNSDGWRYLEAAPNDLGKAVWSWSINWPVGTKYGIGSGKRNTELIIAELNQKGESGSAAQLCKEYTLNGYNDWFLPSKDELNLLYRNLKKNNLGGFLYDSYWSSSQDIYYDAWVQRFSDGSQYLFNYCFKNDAYLVRAVRAFNF